MSLSKILNSAGDRIDISFQPGARHDALVILGHGVTGNMDRPLIVSLAKSLSEAGWPCLRLSFSGNGKSGGRFEDATITKECGDLRAVLASVPDFVRIIYIGHSMGAAVGVLVASSDVRIRALVSLAGMVHTAAFLDREFGAVTPGEGLMWDEPDCPLSPAFAEDMRNIGDVLDAARRVTQPWLIVHGTNDDVVPISDGRDALATSRSGSEWVEIEGAGHSFDGRHEELGRIVASWLDRSLNGG